MGLVDGLQETSRREIMKAIDEDMSRHRLRFAMERLLHNLRHYVRVYLRTPDEQMPDHDIVWETHIGHGPWNVVTDAIKACPALWAPALPTECCIVNREMLRKQVGADLADYMEGVGVNAVDNQAARFLYEIDERERNERYGSRSA